MLTEAGRVLYRHAQAILKQFEQAEADVKRSSTSLSDTASVGLAPSAGGTLSLALLKAARETHPDIMLHIVERFAVAFSELIMNGRIDMAVMQGAGPMRGVSFQPLLVEEFFLVTPVEVPFPGAAQSAIPLASSSAFR